MIKMHLYRCNPKEEVVMVITFFGHRETPPDVHPMLQAQIEAFIRRYNECIFYVGNHGHFDAMVIHILSNMKKRFPHIQCVVALAYMPSANNPKFPMGIETVVPEGIEKTPPRYAIIRRNRWMLEQADAVITYVKYSVGGASRFMEMARKKQKYVINLAADTPFSAEP